MPANLPLYLAPDFVLNAGITQAQYNTWLNHKASAHRQRDARRIRGQEVLLSLPAYRHHIHDAVIHSGGMDHYTGEQLNWSLLSRYNNGNAHNGGLEYRRQFDMLPSVDHIDPMQREFNVCICALRTNDCKAHLNEAELHAFCAMVLQHNQNQ